MKRKKVRMLAAAVLLTVGAVGLIYLPVSMFLSEKKQSTVCAQYSNAAQTIQKPDANEIMEDAKRWNHDLFVGAINPMAPEENGYWHLLNPLGSGIMAVIHIPKIHVDLPIYHGTSAQVLTLGAGHLPNTSLPVGGPSTHAAISAHSGMATAPMFSRLGELKIGDPFFLEVLGQELWYTVDQIRVVLPTEIQDLKIMEGADQVTLITCTPYGLNTHRLLVRGTRKGG